MDKKNSGIKEIPEEAYRDSLIALSYTEPPKDPVQTRESLIALSYTEPPKDPATGRFPDNPKRQYVETLNNDRFERYRSELIKISYLTSPDS